MYLHKCFANKNKYVILKFLFGLLVGFTSSSVFLMEPPCSQECKFEPHFQTIKGNQGIFVGIMTSFKNVETRAQVINNTWKKSISGTTEFFLGDDVRCYLEDDIVSSLPLRLLQKVKDSQYPPQKKSLMLLQWMYELLNSGFDWFMRADDDVYVRGDKLKRLLMKLDAKKPIYLGQTGFGNKKKIGRLGLQTGESYCMGGPGVIFSREIIRRIRPHLLKCLQEMSTMHEDVEVGNCVRRFAGVNCVQALDAPMLFHEFYEKRVGHVDPFDDRYNHQLPDVITLHPNKDPHHFYSVHYYFLRQKILDKIAQIARVCRSIKRFSSEYGLELDPEIRAVGSETVDRYEEANNWSEDMTLQWDLYSKNYLFKTKRIVHIGTFMQDISLELINVVTDFLSKRTWKTQSYERMNHMYEKVVSPLYVQYRMEMIFRNNVNTPYKIVVGLQKNFAPAFIKERKTLKL